MSENTDKQVRCVLCNSEESDTMFIPSNDESKVQLNTLLGVYSHYVKVQARGPSASFLTDLTCQNCSVFFSFCAVCWPHVDKLNQLTKQTQNQIDLIRNIGLMAQDSENDNVSVSHQNVQQQQPPATPSTSRLNFIENEPKRMKMSDDKVQSESQLIFSTSADTGYSDISTTSFGDMVEEEENEEDDEVLVVDTNLNVVQNPDVQMVSIGSSDDDEEEENEPEIIVKQLDVSTYVFLYKDECLCFKRSNCFLKFDCGTCVAQVQNITNIISHLWTDHCDNGKVKRLPNYRIDAYEADGGSGSSSSNASSSTTSETNERNSVVIHDDYSTVLKNLPDGRVYYNPDLPFYDLGGQRGFQCSWCATTVRRDEIILHTNICLPKKRRQLGTDRSTPGNSGVGRTTKTKPLMTPVSKINGWKFYQISKQKFKCGAPNCNKEFQHQGDVLVHIRRVHAGIEDGERTCPQCTILPFKKTRQFWNHLYKVHGIRQL